MPYPKQSIDFKKLNSTNTDYLFHLHRYYPKDDTAHEFEVKNLDKNLPIKLQGVNNEKHLTTVYYLNSAFEQHRDQYILLYKSSASKLVLQNSDSDASFEVLKINTIEEQFTQDIKPNHVSLHGTALTRVKNLQITGNKDVKLELSSEVSEITNVDAYANSQIAVDLTFFSPLIGSNLNNIFRVEFGKFGSRLELHSDFLSNHSDIDFKSDVDKCRSLSEISPDTRGNVLALKWLALESLKKVNENAQSEMNPIVSYLNTLEIITPPGGNTFNLLNLLSNPKNNGGLQCLKQIIFDEKPYAPSKILNLYNNTSIYMGRATNESNQNPPLDTETMHYNAFSNNSTLNYALLGNSNANAPRNQDIELGSNIATLNMHLPQGMNVNSNIRITNEAGSLKTFTLNGGHQKAIYSLILKSVEKSLQKFVGKNSNAGLNATLGCKMTEFRGSSTSPNRLYENDDAIKCLGGPRKGPQTKTLPDILIVMGSQNDYFDTTLHAPRHYSIILGKGKDYFLFRSIEKTTVAFFDFQVGEEMGDVVGLGTMLNLGGFSFNNEESNAPQLSNPFTSQRIKPEDEVKFFFVKNLTDDTVINQDSNFIICLDSPKNCDLYQNKKAPKLKEKTKQDILVPFLSDDMNGENPIFRHHNKINEAYKINEELNEIYGELNENKISAISLALLRYKAGETTMSDFIPIMAFYTTDGKTAKDFHPKNFDFASSALDVIRGFKPGKDTGSVFRIKASSNLGKMPAKVGYPILKYGAKANKAISALEEVRFQDFEQAKKLSTINDEDANIVRIKDKDGIDIHSSTAIKKLVMGENPTENDALVFLLYRANGGFVRGATLKYNVDGNNVVDSMVDIVEFYEIEDPSAFDASNFEFTYGLIAS